MNKTFRLCLFSFVASTAGVLLFALNSCEEEYPKGDDLQDTHWEKICDDVRNIPRAIYNDIQVPFLSNE